MMPIAQNLLAENVATDQVAPIANQALIARAQALLEEIKLDMNLNRGEVTMFIADLPDVPPQNVPVMIAQAKQAQSTDVKTVRTLGVCLPVPNIPSVVENLVDPVAEAATYLRKYEQRKLQNIGTTIILQKPAHGTLRLVTEADRGTLFSRSSAQLDPADSVYAYLPEKGYFGKDKAIALVDIGGVKVKVVFYLQSVEGSAGRTDEPDRFCGKTGYSWKISSTLDVNGNNAIAAIDYQPANADESASASTSRSSALGDGVLSTSGITLNISDLPGTAVGQTTGEGRSAIITLDTNAAGHNWFIDSTPTDNSEYLPTSDANVWKAKAGSAAEGKMDMLSVLLHEYGHALGFEHSSNSADFMSASLVAGERRLPTTDELTLMAQLVAQLKGDTDSPSPTTPPQFPQFPHFPSSPFDPSAPLGGSLGLLALGRLRRNDYGNWSISLNSAQLWAPPAPQPQAQYQAAVNATLVNGNLNSTAGWRSSGNIALNGTTGAGVTLGEGSSADAHLSQGFMINSGDRYLSFTVVDPGLQQNAAGPNDAFEVALLNANTGAALGPTDGLTHSDALLNIQLEANDNNSGSTVPSQRSEHAASNVRKVANADGTATYYIDLQQGIGSASGNVVTGTPALLSFDLIGFGGVGSQGSHISLRDIKLIKDAVAFDDNVATAEDTAATIAPLANDLIGGSTSAVINVVTSPTHGSLTQNADGTFRYVPNANFNGTDSFSYAVTTDGQSSNVATVNLTVNAVNDAPVVPSSAIQIYEDGSLTFDPLANASDVDGDALTTRLVKCYVARPDPDVSACEAATVLDCWHLNIVGSSSILLR